MNQGNPPPGYYGQPQQPPPPPMHPSQMVGAGQAQVQAQPVPVQVLPVQVPSQQPQQIQQPPQPQMGKNVMPTQQPGQTPLTELDFQTDGLVDPILKVKELYGQFKHSLQGLLTQMTIIINPSLEYKFHNSENQFQLFGKAVENFNRVCDLLIINLRTALESLTISSELRHLHKYYAHINQADCERNDVPYISSINIQMQRINDFRNMFQQFLQINNNNNSNIGNNEITTIN